MAHPPTHLAALRSDNGPEFIAQASHDRLARYQTARLSIDPGGPWQNGFAERFNGTVRDECLHRQVFASVAEARLLLERCRREDSEERPPSRLGCWATAPQPHSKPTGSRPTGSRTSPTPQTPLGPNTARGLKTGEHLTFALPDSL
ncbi:MAG: integrase core domain-containing protein [Ktedonobacterales bacterium]